jgi:uncharacterized membrane protein YsdA (DUF1294 family)
MEKHQLNERRFKLPEQIKTRQTEALKDRFAAYGRQKKDAPERASLVQPTRSSVRTLGKSSASWGTGSTVALTGFALIYLGVTLAWGTALILAIGYLGMSLTCAFAYWRDKTAVQNREWRVPESTLLMLGLLGGWPGAIIAQQTLRHKTSKVSFRLAFWATVVLNVGAFIAFTTPLMRIVKS